MAKNKTASERRKSSRLQQHGPGLIGLADSGKDRQSAQVMNISDGGVRLVCQQRLDEDKVYALQLGGEERRIRILHCKKLFDGFAIRGEFLAE